MIDRHLNYGRNVIARFVRDEENVSNIIDIGAGVGVDLLNCGREHPKANLIAIECFSPNVVALENKNIKVLSIDIERDRIPLQDESVDVVVSNQVFEHLKEIFWTANEISRVLKVGGSLIIGVPNLASFHNRLLLLFGRQPTSLKNNSAHVRGYTKSDILRFFHSGFPDGYELEMFAGSNFYPFPPWIAKPLSTLFPSLSWSIFIKLRKIKSYQNGLFLDYVQKNRLETNFWLGPKSDSGP